MIGDGACDSYCNNSECSYDLTDCCNCTATQQENCELECLKPSCAYGEQCSDQFLKDSAKYFQIIKEDYSAQLDLDECFNADSTCTEADLRDFYTGKGKDLSKCRPLECFGQYGQEQCCSADLHCTKCTGEVCLECSEGYYNYYGKCAANCPQGSTTQDKVPGLCFRKYYLAYTDSSTADTQTIKFVGTSDIYKLAAKHSLVEALANTWNAYSVIFIIDSVVAFSPMTQNYRRETSSVSVYSPLEKLYENTRVVSVEIVGNVCSRSVLEGCLQERPEIRVTDVQMTLKVLGFKLLLNSVKITGNYAFQSNCDAATCSYCPFLTQRGELYFDDRHKLYAEEPSWAKCEDNDNSFIVVDCKGSLEISDADLYNFRLKQKAFIEAQGKVDITNLTIENVSSAGSGDGFIVQNCNSCAECIFSLESSSVKYFNNGYEIRDGLEQSSFLKVEGAFFTVISDCSFSYSMVYTSVTKPFLFFKDPAGPISMTGLKFSYIALSSHLIYVLSQTAQELRIGSDYIDVATKNTQVILGGIQIGNVTAQMLVYVYMSSKPKKTMIDTVTIYDSTALYFIYLWHLDIPSSLEVDGGISTIVIDGVRKNYYSYPVTFDVTNLAIFNSRWSSYALKTNLVPNLKLKGVEVNNSGQYYGDLRAFTYKGLVDDEGFYLSILPVIDSVMTCFGTLSISASINLAVSELLFKDVTCYGNTGLEADVYSSVSCSQFTVSSLTSSDAVLTGTGSTGAVIDITSDGIGFTAFLASINISGLKSSGAGAILVSFMKLIIVNSVFKDITAETSAGLHCELCTGFVSINLNFDNLVTKSGPGACINMSFSLNSEASLTLQDSVFHRCQINEYQGAAIYFGYAPTPLTLVMTRLTFSANSSKQAGSAVYVASTAFLKSDSQISDCIFTSHEDSSVSLIDLSIRSSSVFKNCRFTNIANQGAVILLTFASGDHQVSLVNCTFDTIKSTSVFVVTGKSRGQLFSLKDSTVSNAQAYLADVKDARFEAQDCTFTKGEGALMLKNSSAKLTTVTISSFTALQSSGIELYEASTLECRGCIFDNNTGDTGGIRVDSSSQISVLNSKFTYNSGNIGSALYLINTKLPNLVQDSEFSFNYAKAGSTIQIVLSTLTLQRVQVRSNSSSVTAAVNVQNSNLTVLNSGFFNQTATTGAFVALVSSSIGVFQNCSFVNSNGGAIFLLSSSLSIQDASAHNINSRSSSFIEAQGDCELSVVRCTADSLTAYTEGSFLNFAGGSVEMSSVRVSYFNSTALSIKSASKLTLQDSVFECKPYSDGDCAAYCVGYIQNVLTSKVIRSSFRHNQANATCAALYFSEQTGKSDVEVRGSTFDNNTAVEGGALKLSVSTALVTESVFVRNRATGNDGGGITALCASSCSYVFTHNNFTDNKAKLRGGAIYWLSQPTLENNSYSDNSAEYGDDLASFGVSLAVMTTSSETDKRVMQDIQLTGIASGQRMPKAVKIGLIDHYGQVVRTDNSSTADLLPEDASSTSVTGETRVTSEQGVYVFNEAYVTSVPGTRVSFKVSSSAISSEESQADLVVPIQLRDCQSGEAYIGNNCVVCASGTYSLDPNQDCADCPAGAICYGGSLMVPKAGYWRSSKTSDKFLKCNLPDTCLGSPYIVPSLTGVCKLGYRGNLCQACDNGYSVSGPDKCGQCPGWSENVAKLLGIGIAIMLYSAVLVRSSLKTAYMPQALHSIYLKIFTNYLQLVMLTTELDLNWPSFVRSFYKQQSYAGQVDQQLFSFDCFLIGQQASGDDYTQVYFDKLVIQALLPVIISLGVLVFWMTVYYFSRRESILRKELIASLVILFFLVHPGLVKDYFGAFSCRRLDDDSLWLNANLDIKCFSDNHATYAFLVALPAILVWGIGVPTLILAILIKNRNSLDDIVTKCRVGFFYNGFRKSHFYWEFLILYRKIIIISLVVFVGNESIPIQALTIMIFLLVFLYLQYWRRPYSTSGLNDIELRAIMVAAVTIYCGIYYLTEQLPEWFKVLLFTIMLLANAYFLIIFGKEFLRTVLEMLGANLRWFKLFAIKIDAFPDSEVVSRGFTRDFSYLVEGEVKQTLCRVRKPVEDISELEEVSYLDDLFINAQPSDAFGRVTAVLRSYVTDIDLVNCGKPS
jgi:hypothetical protein